MTLLLMTDLGLSAADIGGLIRSGPVISETQPNWRLGITFDYEFPKAAFGIGVDMVVSTKHPEAPTDEELRLNMVGLFAECRYFLMSDDRSKASVGATFGIRNIAYENASNNSFNPTDLVPSVPDSPLGSTMHAVICPFVQYEYYVLPWLDVFGRVGYDLHIGPDYVDVTAASLSGVTVQLGIRVPIS